MLLLQETHFKKADVITYHAYICYERSQTEQTKVAFVRMQNMKHMF